MSNIFCPFQEPPKPVGFFLINRHSNIMCNSIRRHLIKKSLIENGITDKINQDGILNAFYGL